MSKRKKVLKKSSIERVLNNSLIGFAKSHNLIRAITKGVNPEYGSEVYYFIVKPPYDDKFQDEVTNLELKLYKEKYECNLAEWPCRTEISNYILDYPFLGNILWERD